MLDKQLWDDIQKMFEESEASIECIPGNQTVGTNQVNELMVNYNSVLATIVYTTAGITVNKCIRILGQGNDEIPSICEINEIRDGYPERIKGFLIVATDIFGGMYAMNVTELNGKMGMMHYFAPDTLEWEPLDMKYAQFLSWAVDGNTEEFYESMKWSDWEKYADETRFDQGILIYPFLWSKEIKIESATKKIVPFQELINVNMDYRKKFFD